MFLRKKNRYYISVVKFPPPVWLNTMPMVMIWTNLKKCNLRKFQNKFQLFWPYFFFYEDVYTIWFLIIPNYFYLKSLVFILQTWISFTYWCILRSLVEIGYVERKRIGALLIVFQLINDFFFIVLLTYLALKPYLCKCILWFVYNFIYLNKFHQLYCYLRYRLQKEMSFKC